MKRYVKPSFMVTEFNMTDTVASCDRLVIGTETTTVYEKQYVHCIIGNQSETVFNSASGCTTSSTKWGVTDYNGKTYFVWYTYAGDTAGGAPSQNSTEIRILNALVTQLGQQAGSGWHYSEVTSSDLVTDVLGFSY